MRRCIFRRDNLIEELEQMAGRTGIKAAEANVLRIKASLAETLTERQMALLREFDDAVINEGTLRVNAALALGCGCGGCQA